MTYSRPCSPIRTRGNSRYPFRDKRNSAGSQFVSGNFFDSLGIGPAAGRLIYDSDNLAGAPAVAVLSYNYWRDRFAGDTTAIGRRSVSAIPFTICGVAAPEFFGLAPGSAPALYIPIGTRPLSRTALPHRRTDFHVHGCPLLLDRHDGTPAPRHHDGSRRGGDRNAVSSVR